MSAPSVFRCTEFRMYFNAGLVKMSWRRSRSRCRKRHLQRQRSTSSLELSWHCASHMTRQEWWRTGSCSASESLFCGPSSHSQYRRVCLWLSYCIRFNDLYVYIPDTWIPIASGVMILYPNQLSLSEIWCGNGITTVLTRCKVIQACFWHIGREVHCLSAVSASSSSFDDILLFCPLFIWIELSFSSCQWWRSTVVSKRWQSRGCGHCNDIDGAILPSFWDLSMTVLDMVLVSVCFYGNSGNCSLLVLKICIS